MSESLNNDQNNNTTESPENKNTPANDTDSKANETDSNAQITPDVEAFYRRADAIIELANSQLSPEAHSGKVGASLMYASARYSASVASIGFVKGDDLLKEKAEIVKFYTQQFQQMLSDNLDDYAKNFDTYVQMNKDNNK